MIAVNTNVLLRYLLRDDAAQAERARRIFERAERILITDVVLAEAVWTLIGRRYRATKADVVAVVEKLLQEPTVRFEDDEVIWSALQAYRETDVDFADALIVHKAPENGSHRRCVASGLHLRTLPLCSCLTPPSRSAHSARDSAKAGDCLKEIEETGYWLELLVDSGIVSEDRLERLRNECGELTAIFVTSIRNAKSNNERGA